MRNSRFLVTGGSQGIGAAVVDQARKAGHKVVFTGRDQKRIKEVESQTGAIGLAAEVASAEDNRRTIETCREQMGAVDVLINNAGYAYRADIGSVDLAAMRAMFDVNVFGLVDITNKVVPMMKEQGFGDIINIASTSGMKGGAGGTPYGASKWAV